MEISTTLRTSRMLINTRKEIPEYIGRNYKYRMDTRLAVKSLQYVPSKMPEYLDDNATKTELRIWEKSISD